MSNPQQTNICFLDDISITIKHHDKSFVCTHVSDNKIPIADANGFPVIWQKMIVTSDDLDTTGAANGIPHTYIIENTAIENVGVSVQKKWVDGEYLAGRPEKIDADLYRDGELYDTVELSEANGWYHAWTDLTDEYEWTVDESAVPADYEKTVSNSGSAWTLTNTREVIDIEGVKVWELNGWDDDVVLPESVTIRLYADGEEVAATTASKATEWTWSFDGMPLYMDGEEIEYTISEDRVEDFVPAVTGDAEAGFVLTNTYDPKLGGLIISKTVKGDGASETQKFTFTLTLTGMTGELNCTGAVNVTFGASEPLTFTLAHGQSVAIEGILAGTQYSVVETAHKDYTSAVVNGSGTVVEGKSIKVDFVNTYEEEDDVVVIPKTGDAGSHTAALVLISLAVMWLGVGFYVIKRKLFA